MYMYIQCFEGNLQVICAEKQKFDLKRQYRISNSVQTLNGKHINISYAKSKISIQQDNQ